MPRHVPATAADDRGTEGTPRAHRRRRRRAARRVHPDVGEGARVAAREARGHSRSRVHQDAAGNLWATLKGKSRQGAAHRRAHRLGPQRRLARRLPERARRRRSAAAHRRRGHAAGHGARSSIGATRKARGSAAACSAPARRRARSSPDEVRNLTDRDGIKLADAVKQHGIDLDRALEARKRAEERRRVPRAAHRAGPGAAEHGPADGRGARHVRRRAARDHVHRPGGAFRLDADVAPPRCAGRRVASCTWRSARSP